LPQKKEDETHHPWEGLWKRVLKKKLKEDFGKKREKKIRKANERAGQLVVETTLKRNNSASLMFRGERVEPPKLGGKRYDTENN